MKAHELDEAFDRGEDISDYLDWSTARRPHMPDTCLAAYAAGETPSRDDERAAVKATLDLLKQAAPGRSVEVRIPPYAAVQVVEGVNHRRGTPSAVVEADARTWLQLASGQLAWNEAVKTGRVRASGERSDLSGYLPLF